MSFAPCFRRRPGSFFKDARQLLCDIACYIDHASLAKKCFAENRPGVTHFFLVLLALCAVVGFRHSRQSRWTAAVQTSLRRRLPARK